MPFFPLAKAQPPAAEFSDLSAAAAPGAEDASVGGASGRRKSIHRQVSGESTGRHTRQTTPADSVTSGRSGGGRRSITSIRRSVSKQLAFQSQSGGDGKENSAAPSAADSPRLKPAPPKVPRAYDWLRPGRIKLSQVTPRQILERRKYQAGEKQDPLSPKKAPEEAEAVQRDKQKQQDRRNCERFEESCKTAERADVDGACQFTMTFFGAGAATVRRPSHRKMRFAEMVVDVPVAEDGSSAFDSYMEGDTDEEGSKVTTGESPIVSEAAAEPTAATAGVASSVANSGASPGDIERLKQPQQNKRPSGVNICNRKNHPIYLRDKVYHKSCEELDLRINTGVEKLLMHSGTCFCNLSHVSFKNLLLGDRGVQGILPLFRSGRRLRSLSLVGNHIREKGLKLVSDALSEAGILLGLSVLDLSANPIASASAMPLTSLLKVRADVLLLGLTKTMIPSLRRQFLSKVMLSKFTDTDPELMCDVWQYASPTTGFCDCELWMSCTPIIEEKCTREQIAECFEKLGDEKACEVLKEVFARRLKEEDHSDDDHHHHHHHHHHDHGVHHTASGNNSDQLSRQMSRADSRKYSMASSAFSEQEEDFEDNSFLASIQREQQRDSLAHDMKQPIWESNSPSCVQSRTPVYFRSPGRIGTGKR
eukprot:TRINITY_DN32794_c0_g2_i1.p1 TRINITY_DN32794_c0_g2~~TRINITY_DN32794_c0_g2_i1.p1  ORF type:complete len:649 (+),score=138.35 TRINITY_DN32794_c0_g2_i1:134-2080(+)